MSHSNDKKNSSDTSQMLKEIAIFDYVAGNQSDSAKRNFEKLLEQDPQLKGAVEAEVQLRQQMQKVGQAKPVAMSNFDALLEKIERNDDQQHTTNKQEKVTVLSKFKAASNAKYYATAASIAAIAIVFSNLYVDATAPKFQTLSDITASQKIDFNTLASQSRLAKLTLVNDLDDDQLNDLLVSFELTRFESGAALNQRFVIAKKSLSEDQLNRLRNDTRVKSIELLALTQGE